MPYRGRLIFPITIDVYRHDLVATAQDPDGAGALTSGFDPIYREAVLVPSADRLGASARKETLVSVPAQVSPTDYRKVHMIRTGDASEARVTAVVFIPDLEQRSLVRSDGSIVLAKGDRLDAFRKMDGTLIESVPTPPGLYLVEVLPIFGLSGDRNLLELVFMSRREG